MDLPLLEKLPDLTNSEELEQVQVARCPRLVEIPGRLESLVQLRILDCESLQKFSHPSSFKRLEHLDMEGCEKFKETLKSDEYRDLRKVTPPYSYR
ncbi:hypothetical protein NL676_019555 [Syzygium grande]|nr:hypothetical protein NL676_019555 [Syzygium grande]